MRNGNKINAIADIVIFLVITYLEGENVLVISFRCISYS